MLRIKLITDNIHYACGFAGAVRSALHYVKAGVNSPFEFSIESNNPTIQNLAKNFISSKGPEEIIVLPETEDELRALDIWSTERMLIELTEGQGIVIDQKLEVSTQTYDRLASNILKKDYQLHNKPDYFYNPSLAKQSNYYDILASTAELAEIGIKFLEGYDSHSKKPPTNYSIKITGEYEGLNEVFNKPRIVVCRPDHPMLIGGLQLYTGYENMINSVPFLVQVPDSWEDIDIRAAIQWSGVIPFHLSEGNDAFHQKGSVWATRAKYNFDHHRYQKAVAAGEG